MAITREDIIQAATDLQSNGINPSMAAVRDRLGGGSFATISPVLREWKEGKEQRATVAIEMPGEAKTAIDRAGADIWRIITGLATERLTKVQNDAEESIKASIAERDEALGEIERLEAALAQKTDDLSESLATQDLMRNDLQDASDEIKQLEIKTADKERIEADLAEVKAENKILLAAKTNLTETLSDLKHKLSQAEQAATKSADQLSEKDSQVTKLLSEKNTLDLHVQKLQIALDASESKSTDLKNEINQARKSINDLERETGALAGELKAIKSELAVARTDAKKSSEEAAELRGRLAALTTKPAKAKTEKTGE